MGALQSPEHAEGISTTERIVRTANRARTAMFAAGTVLALWGGYQVYDAVTGIEVHAPDLDFSELPEGVSAKPSELEAEIEPESYEVQGTFNMACKARIGVAIPVQGHREGELWGFFGLTDADISKVLYADALACTDATSIDSSLTITKEGDEITAITAVMPSLGIAQPRVDHLDWRNQVDIRPEDTPEERIAKFDAFRENGENVDVRGGFECGGYCSVDSVELIHAANIMAQLAFEIDGKQPNVLAIITQEYRKDLVLQLAKRFNVDPSIVQVGVDFGDGLDPNQDLSIGQIEEIYRDRVSQLLASTALENGGQCTAEQDLAIEGSTCDAASIFSVEPEVRTNEDGSMTIYAQLVSGAQLTVDLSGIRYSPEINAAIIKEIEIDLGIEREDDNMLMLEVIGDN